MKNFLFQKLKRIRENKERVSQNSSDFASLINKGDLCIDCGAHIGDVTEKMAERGGVVYSFEPNPYAFNYLKKRVGHLNNVNLINKAVFNSVTKKKLHFHVESAKDPVKWAVGSSLNSEKGNVSQEEYVEVETVDLSSFISNLGQKVKVLKIDVEGVEFDILNKILDDGTYKLVDQIFVETHEKQIPSLFEEKQKILKRIRKMKVKNINLNWF